MPTVRRRCLQDCYKLSIRPFWGKGKLIHPRFLESYPYITLSDSLSRDERQEYHPFVRRTGHGAIVGSLQSACFGGADNIIVGITKVLLAKQQHPLSLEIGQGVYAFQHFSVSAPERI